MVVVILINEASKPKKALQNWEIPFTFTKCFHLYSGSWALEQEQTKDNVTETAVVQCTLQTSADIKQTFHFHIIVELLELSRISRDFNVFFWELTVVSICWSVIKLLKCIYVCFQSQVVENSILDFPHLFLLPVCFCAWHPNILLFMMQLQNLVNAKIKLKLVQ